MRQGFQDRSRGMKGSQESLTTVVLKDGQAAPDNPSTHGSRLESWAMPEGMAGGKISRGGKRKNELLLTGQVKAWATPQTRDNRSGGAERWDNPNKSRNLNDQLATATTQNAKLNPRWVETLMGLPVGWVMPSCTHPIASPATVVMESYAGSAENTTGSAHALGQIATMTDNRTDELRLLGNGVVPATAAKAFKTLIQAFMP